MLYRIKAQPISQEMHQFWTMLNDGTLGKQQPDGREIVASMKRAVISDGAVEWSETCYCSPPLNHERTTIYDKFFTGMEISPVNLAPRLQGQRFWNYLEELEKEEPRSASKAGPVRLRIL